jgi:hypothetical protein
MDDMCKRDHSTLTLDHDTGHIMKEHLKPCS